MSDLSSLCPVCNFPLDDGSLNEKPGADRISVCCHRCGELEVSRSMNIELRSLPKDEPEKRMLVSHFIHRMRNSENDVPLITGPVFDKITANERFPTPVEQVDLMLLWLGKMAPKPGTKHPLFLETYHTIIGAIDEEGLNFALESAQDLNFVNLPANPDGLLDPEWVQMTIDGWQRYEELVRGAPSGTKAFMALKFDKEDLERALEDCFKPSVNQTGFSLQTVGDNRKAGLIDDKIRVDIRNARFLISDLTHGNQGAY